MLWGCFCFFILQSIPFKHLIQYTIFYCFFFLICNYKFNYLNKLINSLFNFCFVLKDCVCVGLFVVAVPDQERYIKKQQKNHSFFTHNNKPLLCYTEKKIYMIKLELNSKNIVELFHLLFFVCFFFF